MPTTSMVNDSRRRLCALARRHDWMITRESDRQLRFSKWTADLVVRYDLVVIVDPLGRVQTWSIWRNHRMTIDGETGRRQRLEQHLATWDRSVDQDQVNALIDGMIGAITGGRA